MPPHRTTDDTDANAGTAGVPKSRRGTNQYKNCPPKDCPKTAEALRDYQRRLITDKNKISKLLKEEHGILLSAASVTRRRRDLGLTTIRDEEDDRLFEWHEECSEDDVLFDDPLSEVVRKQLIKHSGKNIGTRTVRKHIAEETGMIISRDIIAAEMREQDRDGVVRRRPRPSDTLKQSTWSAMELGFNRFDVFAIRDLWSGRWLGLHIKPHTDRPQIWSLAQRYLRVVRDVGGIPVQSTTDCNSAKVMQVLANTSREALTSFLCAQGSLVSPFLQGVNSIQGSTIEWNVAVDQPRLGVLFKTLDDKCTVFVDQVDRQFDEHDGLCWYLTDWLMEPLIQKELDAFCKAEREQLAQDRNGTQRYPLESVDTARVSQLIEDIGGEDTLRYPNAQYDRRARDILVQTVFPTLGQEEVTWENAPQVFEAMVPYAPELYELRW